jgi:hypothetical protein
MLSGIVLLVLLLIVSIRSYGGYVHHNQVYVDSKHPLHVKNQVSGELLFLQKRTRRFVDEVCRVYPKNKAVQRLANWSGDLRELRFNTDHILASNTNKGEVISVCLVDREGRLNARNDVMWVLLHELAHVMTSQYRHDDEFWKHNRFLVKEAVKMGYYDYTSYTKTPKKFCGSVIRYNF